MKEELNSSSFVRGRVKLTPRSLLLTLQNWLDTAWNIKTCCWTDRQHSELALNTWCTEGFGEFHPTLNLSEKESTFKDEKFKIAKTVAVPDIYRSRAWVVRDRFTCEGVSHHLQGSFNPEFPSAFWPCLLHPKSESYAPQIKSTKDIKNKARRLFWKHKTYKRYKYIRKNIL